MATVEHSLPATNAAEVFDATDLMLCSWFIAMHAHPALESFRDPRLEPKVAQGFTTEVINPDEADGLQYGCSKFGPGEFRDLLVFLPQLLRFTCKRQKKRRGWDSNPRDDLTPPTRFPIALLRPTRTPLRGRRTGVYQKANLLLLPFSRSRSGSRRPSSPVYRPRTRRRFRNPWPSAPGRPASRSVS
jgi:hypothetical protein